MKSDKRYFILRDGAIVASTATREQAVLTVKSYQDFETHYLLKANFSIIYGEEELVPYSK